MNTPDDRAEPENTSFQPEDTDDDMAPKLAIIFGLILILILAITMFVY